MRAITLDRVQLDYLTITSFEPAAWDVFMQVLSAASCDDPKDSQRMQYLGYELKTALGSIFAGTADQRGRMHSLMQVSGELAADADIINLLRPGIVDKWLKVTRLDLQCTIEEPEGWSQWALFNRFQKRKIPCGWVESASKKTGKQLATVYIGKRENGRFTRVYQKETVGGNMLLRAEFELKRGQAMAFVHHMLKGKNTPAELYKLLLDQHGDKALHAAYANALEGIRAAGRPATIELERDTARWLMETVLPSFKRVINDHDESGDIRQAFKAAIHAWERDNTNWGSLEQF